MVKTLLLVGLLVFGALFLTGLVGPGVPAVDNSTDDGSVGNVDDLDTDSSAREAAVEREIHAEVNDVRTGRNLRRLEYDDEVAVVARAHSEDMAEREYFSHVGPDGEDVGDRLSAAGVDCRAVGENLGYLKGYGTEPEPTAERVVEGWLNSEGHRENLFRSEWEVEGIGVEIRGDAVWATQVFCSGMNPYE